MNAKVEISLTDLDTLRKDRERWEAEYLALRKQFDELRTAVALAKPGDLPSLVDGPNMAAALNHALTVITFAIGNLDPLTVRGWPAADLLALAELLPKLPGLDPLLVELWCDWRIFARRAAEWEAARALGIEREKLADENSAKIPGSRYGEMPGEPILPE